MLEHYNTRALGSSVTGHLLVHRATTATRQRRAFSIVDPSSWNGLPLEIRLLPKNNESAFCRLPKFGPFCSIYQSLYQSPSFNIFLPVSQSDRSIQSQSQKSKSIFLFQQDHSIVCINQKHQKSSKKKATQ